MRHADSEIRLLVQHNAEHLENRLLLSADFPEFVDPNPNPGNQFGHSVVPLSTGNVVVTSPYDDAGGTDAGAVYLFNGESGELISTLTGSNNDDRVGFGNGSGSGGVTALGTGNFVITSGLWDNGAATDAGAVTFGSGTAGVSGVVSSANSLVGSQTDDNVGARGVVALTNGNYVVQTSEWDNGSVSDVGAATFGNGTTGVTGEVSVTNSLVGSSASDRVGISVTALTNGNYVVGSYWWNNNSVVDAGALTFGDGTSGISGPVTTANSLVGSSSRDQVGRIISGGGSVTALPNGNYVVVSPDWNNGATVDAGAVTFGNGTSGVSGPVTTANSLVGTSTEDRVGSGGITVLNNNNYVVASPSWDNVTVSDAGAATFGDGTIGVNGIVSTTNSLVGSNDSDRVSDQGVTALTNDNYVVQSSFWDNGAAIDAGAATLGFGTSGISGPVSTANSLVGSSISDEVGFEVTALTNGNYVVQSPGWDNGAMSDAGAATFGSGSSGISGMVSTSNSLVGTTGDDSVGAIVTALSNGNYVVASPDWDNGPNQNAGAATFGSGTVGISGPVSTFNSLVGSQPDDVVGNRGVAALTNGNYVVQSNKWHNGAVPNVGAVTFGDGTNGIIGIVSPANSLVGSTSGDRVGSRVTALTNGNYVVASSIWRNGTKPGAGAVTFGNGLSGITGVVSTSNSLVGSSNLDNVGDVTALSNGNYIVKSSSWDNGPLDRAGTMTFGSGTNGVSGPVTTDNSLIGLSSDTRLLSAPTDEVNWQFYARFLDEDGGRVRVGSQLDGVGLHDFGDAPDTNPGTAVGDYRTRQSDDGPRHHLDSRIQLGATVDGESPALANAAANGDDVNGDGADDEDGVSNPLADLTLTVGAAPAVTVIVNNTTGSHAKLTGWIDYNANGIFDNLTERAQATVLNGSTDKTVTLTFPDVPFGFTGTTYARFRLSTDVAAEDPTGLARDGEVEDYPVTIVNPTSGEVASQQKISDTIGGFSGALGNGDFFGKSIANVGDLNGDGVSDLVVGAQRDDDGGANRGAVWVLFMAANGTVQAHQKISQTDGGFTGTLSNADWFGDEVASLGDLDGDGVTDIAVGAPRDDDGGGTRGAVWILFLNSNGTVKGHQKISDTAGSFTGALNNGDQFGAAVTALGDLNGDGVTDLAVGASHDDDGGSNRGAVWALFLNSDGTVKSHQKISATAGGFTGTLANNDQFAGSLATLGDQDGDGAIEIAVGAPRDDAGGVGAGGAVWVISLAPDGSVKGHQKISAGQGGFTGTLDREVFFGSSLTSVGDLDGDGITDLAVGSPGDRDGGTLNVGAAWLLFLNPDGTVRRHQKISKTAGSFSGNIGNGDWFGTSVSFLGDLDGNGTANLAIGARGDDDGGTNRGGVWIVDLARPVFVVTNTNNNGTGSLRRAIVDANNRSGMDVIEFNIPGNGAHRIQPTSALQTISDKVMIDGTTQPGFTSSPLIVLDGSVAGAAANGLKITAGGSVVKGLSISDFARAGIELRNGDGSRIEGNFIGTDGNGTQDNGNARSGVLIVNSSGNTIGGATTDRRNVISGNNRHGIEITGTQSTRNAVRGNHIGTNAAGTADIGNSLSGILISNASSNTIGGTANGVGNVISGNNRHGVEIVNSAAISNVVRGNYIGTNAVGTAAIGNGVSGIFISRASSNVIGGSPSGAGNVISGNIRHGVEIRNSGATNNSLRGNLIGTNAAGTAAVGNALNGVLIVDAPSNTIGGTANGTGNTIAFNGQNGVRVTGTVTENRINRNSMFSNSAIGIDLGGNGSTANDTNDPDGGTNKQQNFPVITNVVLNGQNLSVTYSVPSSTANSTFPLRIEFFIADANNQEGKTFLASKSYNTPGSKTVNVAGGGAVAGTRIVATATDADGNTSEFSANAIVGSALLAESGEAPDTSRQRRRLTKRKLAPIVDAAITRLAAQGLTTAQVERLSSVTFAIADLPDATLGQATPETITLDVNAAGYGWYIDRTPFNDSEFAGTNSFGGTHRRASRSMDLLTVVMHELGHTIGLTHEHGEHSVDDLMNDTLTTGTRRTTFHRSLDELFGDTLWL